MEKINMRKAKDVLQFIEDRGISFEKVIKPDGDELVHIYATTNLGKKIHYANYPIRGYLDSRDEPARKGWLREAVEFAMDMEEGI